jgi:hypothetical protein
MVYIKICNSFVYVAYEMEINKSGKVEKRVA